MAFPFKAFPVRSYWPASGPPYHRVFLTGNLHFTSTPSAPCSLSQPPRCPSLFAGSTAFARGSIPSLALPIALQVKVLALFLTNWLLCPFSHVLIFTGVAPPSTREVTWSFPLFLFFFFFSCIMAFKGFRTPGLLRLCHLLDVQWIIFIPEHVWQLHVLTNV